MNVTVVCQPRTLGNVHVGRRGALTFIHVEKRRIAGRASAPKPRVHHLVSVSCVVTAWVTVFVCALPPVRTAAVEGVNDRVPTAVVAGSSFDRGRGFVSMEYGYARVGFFQLGGVTGDAPSVRCLELCTAP